MSDVAVLPPGRVAFSRVPLEWRTQVAAGVLVAVWHPQLRFAGICHYLLPVRGERAAGHADGRHGSEALQLLDLQMRLAGTRADQYVVHVCGAALVDHDRAGAAATLALQNLACADAWIARQHLRRGRRRVGGAVVRSVSFHAGLGVLELQEQSGFERGLQ